MDRYCPSSIQVVSCGRQDCSDMHQWGPGMRPCYILHYVIKGAGYLECDKKKYRIETGMCFLTYPFVKIRYYPDPNDPWEYTWIDFIGNDVPKYLAASGLNLRKPVSPVIEASAILPLFERLIKLDLHHRNKMEANGLMLAILGICADTLPADKDEAIPKEDLRLLTAILLIHTNYHQSSFHIESLCSKMNINRVTLYRLFQTRLGYTPSSYLLRYRLKQAQKMLLMGSSVKSASISCGFSDPFYFSKVFKQHIGVAPSEYSARQSNLSLEENEYDDIELYRI